LQPLKQFLNLPASDEREKISEEFDNLFGFDGYVGVIDGTHCLLASKPFLDGEIYYGRKKI